MKFDENLRKFIKIDIQNQKTVFLAGESGIGKSMFVNALAREIGSKCFTLACNTLATKEDLTGARTLPVKNSQGEETFAQFFFPHSIVDEAITYAESNPRENVFLLMDEINRTESDVTSALLTFDTDRRIGNRKLPKNLKLIAAGNLRGNVTTLDEASLSRFAIYNVHPDAGVFLGLMEQANKLNPHVKAVLTKRPDLIFCRKLSEGGLADGNVDDDDDDVKTMKLQDLEDVDDMAQITTPRTIEGLNDGLNALTDDDIQEMISTESHHLNRTDNNSLLHEWVEAHVGETEFASELLSVISVALQSPQTTTVNVNTAPPRPVIYDSLKNAGTVDEIAAIISDSNVTDRERAAALTYALYEKEDNKTLVKAIAENVSDNIFADVEDNQRITKLAIAGDLDSENLSAFENSDTGISNKMAFLCNL